MSRRAWQMFFEAGAEVLPAMAGDEDESLGGVDEVELAGEAALEGGVGVANALNDVEQRVDDGVAGDVNGLWVDAFAQEVGTEGLLGRGEVDVGERAASRRFISSGQGAYLSPVRRPASTCPTRIRA